jgi:hypothetical protein
MAVQNRADQTTEQLILSGESLTKNVTIVQNAQRATPLLANTVMAYIAATGFWTPWISVAGVDGSAVPRGIYQGDDIVAADLVDGDIVDVPMLVGDAIVNENLVICDDDTLTLESVIGAGTIQAVTGRQALEDTAGIIVEECISISHVEN